MQSSKKDSFEDYPPMSRLFIICNKDHNEEDFREAFSRFGVIEDIWIVKDKYSHANKGIAYIKFAKTSDAAKAQEEMNGKNIGSCKRSLKILVAASRSKGSSKFENEYDKCVRLFIVVSKEATEEEIYEQFSNFGGVENVSIVKDKTTGISKGFAYVRFAKFYHAALAFENCSSKFKAVFAEPKGTDRKRGNSDRKMDTQIFGHIGADFSQSNNKRCTEMSEFLNMDKINTCQSTCLEITCSKCINQDQIWKLFDIIPGLDYCQITCDSGSRNNEAVVVYNNPEAANYAKEKLHGLEYPLGERIIIKSSGLQAHEIGHFFNSEIKPYSVCSVPLPNSEELAPSDAVVEQRLFIVLTSNLPQIVLKKIFSCWKGLIDAYLLPNKNCGYVKYANKESAQKAMHTLNGAEIHGTKIKVMEAEERSESDIGDNFRKKIRRN